MLRLSNDEEFQRKIEEYHNVDWQSKHSSIKWIISKKESSNKKKKKSIHHLIFNNNLIETYIFILSFLKILRVNYFIFLLIKLLYLKSKLYVPIPIFIIIPLYLFSILQIDHQELINLLTYDKNIHLKSNQINLIMRKI